jgi:hypothetical protein
VVWGTGWSSLTPAPARVPCSALKLLRLSHLWCMFELCCFTLGILLCVIATNPVLLAGHCALCFLLSKFQLFQQSRSP